VLYVSGVKYLSLYKGTFAKQISNRKTRQPAWIPMQFDILEMRYIYESLSQAFDAQSRVLAFSIFGKTVALFASGILFYTCKVTHIFNIFLKFNVVDLNRTASAMYQRHFHHLHFDAKISLRWRDTNVYKSPKTIQMFLPHNKQGLQ
jgi:hypothetical protein